jgi:branched-chain amino acid transport system substrate-binding protein
MGKCKFFYTLTLTLLLSLLSAPSDPIHGLDPNEDRDVIVAVLLDLEGAQASIGQPAMNGFVLALQKADASRMTTLFATLMDTKTDPATTLQAARKAVTRVTIGAGFTDNDSILIAGPLFQEKSIPFLSIGATDPALPQVIGKSIFLVPFGDNTQAAAAAEFAHREFGATVAILFDATAQYSRTLPRYFRTRFESLGGQVLLDRSYDGGCDIASLGTQVVNLSPPPAFIYLAGLPDCIGDIVASLRAAGVHQPLIGGDGLDTPNLLLGGEEPMDEVWYSTHAWLSPETGTPSAQRFIATYQQAYGTPPEDAFAALGYDAANLLLDVVQRVEKVEPQEMIKALEATHDFQGVTGAISYTEQNHVPQKTVWIIRVAGGRRSLATSFVPDVVPPALVPTP